MDNLRELGVHLQHAHKQARLIHTNLQVSNGQYEPSIWETQQELQKNALRWTTHLGIALSEVLEQIHRYKVKQQRKCCVFIMTTYNLDEIQEKCNTLEGRLMDLSRLVNVLKENSITLCQVFNQNQQDNFFIQTQDTVYLVYEPQTLESQLSSTNLKPVKSKDPEDTGYFRYDANTDKLTATFKKLVLEKVMRTSVRGNDKVSEEKLGLLFRVEGSKLQDIQTVSLPIVITVHANQELDGEGTIMWDNAFRNIAYCRHIEHPCLQGPCIQARSLNVPSKVQWSELAPVLRTYFKAKIDCDLTDTDMQYLGEIIYRGSLPSDGSVTWRDFAKNNLPGKEHTFWGWFRSLIKVMDMYDKVIAKMWKKQLIMGLISSETSLKLLSQYPEGTFVIRPSSFQESFCADVIVSTKTTTSIAQHKRIESIQYVPKKCQNKSLAEVILEVPTLKYILTPTSDFAIPKETALAEFIKTKEPQAEGPNGYKQVVLRCTTLLEKNELPSDEGTSYPVTSLLQSTDSRDTMDIDSVASSGYSSHPGTPAFLNQPGSPAFSNQPLTPEFLNQPENPGFSNSTGAPTFSNQPGSPVFINQLVTPAFLTQPGTPVFPNKPETSTFSSQPRPFIPVTETTAAYGTSSAHNGAISYLQTSGNYVSMHQESSVLSPANAFDASVAQEHDICMNPHQQHNQEHILYQEIPPLTPYDDGNFLARQDFFN